MPDEIDPYKTLQVDPEADAEVVQAAYRRLARKYHPDVMPGPEAAARMVALNRAWAMLEDPNAREAYDRARADRLARERRGAAMAADAPAPSRGGRGPTSARQPTPQPPAPDGVSSDWTPGRSTVGSRYDPGTMGARDGFGAAGAPPGNASGSVLAFGRYAGWSVGEIGRRDLEYLEWLDRVPIGRPYRPEIDAILRRAGRRRAAPGESGDRRGLFRRG